MHTHWMTLAQDPESWKSMVRGPETLSAVTAPKFESAKRPFSPIFIDFDKRHKNHTKRSPESASHTDFTSKMAFPGKAGQGSKKPEPGVGFLNPSGARVAYAARRRR